MKKLLFLFLLLFLFSCEKDRCWRCSIITRTTSSDTSSDPGLYSVLLDTCSLSEREINAFRKTKSKTVTETTDGVTVTSTTNCNCVVISFL